MKLYMKLFGAFFRIGLFTFGGGYSMLPMLQREVVDKYGWATNDELLDCFSISQCTPGVIAVNSATLIGYKQAKLAGALFATIGVITPSIIIITIIAATLQNFMHIAAVAHAFAGIRVAVAALIVSAVIKLIKSNVLQQPAEDGKQGPGPFFKRHWLRLLLFILSFAIVAFFSVSPIFIVAGAILTGIALVGKAAA
ncbi:MAG: chromate transporter [Clostridiales bacterium]|nr:chromate transporter [Clostridiales bacterium]